MRLKNLVPEKTFSILTLDDDPIMTSTIQSFFQRAGYKVDVENDPLAAIERIRNGKYDILLLDFLMSPICGDQVVERIREFDKDISIIMLTGHKDMAPPLQTMRFLDIQSYYEKSDRFDQLELLVESCVKSIRQLRTIRGYRNGLSTMLESMPEFYHVPELAGIAEKTLDIARTFLPCTGGVMALKLDDGEKTGWTVRSLGFGKQLTDSEAENTAAVLAGGEPVFGEREVRYPLEAAAAVSGFIWLQVSETLSEEQRQLIGIFMRQVSAAVDNALLNEILTEKNDELDKAYKDLGNSYAEMITTVRKIVDEKDLYTRNHSDRVSFYAVELAKRLGRDGHYCSRLRIAGLFHDIGKLGVPDRILQKDGKLSDEEYREITAHADRGAKLLSGLTAFRDIVPWVRSHHERYDGKGYPCGISGEDIPEQARIIAIADAFDAMTLDRRYRPALTLENAVAELEKGRGSQFDPDFAAVFISMVRDTDCVEKAKNFEFEQDPFGAEEVK